MIKVLDSFIADKIAAGEVIERPVSIVKELIENSIDAGSSNILVEIKNGGKSYIRVTDNGEGIPSNEISIAFLRHATSKISSISDLDSINSLGFRGEALASIAAVSRLTIISKTANSGTGLKLLLHGGKEINNDIVGANTGTTLIIEDVFYNTPARRKFMASDSREASAIIRLVEEYAVYYTKIKFTLVNNGSTIFTTDGKGNNLNTIRQIFPEKDYSDLIEIKSTHLLGYISNPGITKSSRIGQLFFVNGRLVNSSLIEKAIEKGYGNRIFSGFPIAILFLNVDPATVDVNIHPGKKEINFLNKSEISDEIINAISSAMNLEKSIPSNNLELKVKENSNINYTGKSSNESFNSEKYNQDESKPVNIHEFLDSLKREVEKNKNIESISQKSSPDLSKDVNKETDFSSNGNSKSDKDFDFNNISLKGYVFNSYLIMEGNETLYILDQHAAHERIFYEKFINNYKNEKQIPQDILTPFTINVDSSIYALDREWITTLSKFGYEISDFGQNTFQIRGIPKFMSLKEAELFVKMFIDNLDDFSDNQIVIDKLIMKSCKAAVKANNKLSSMEIKDLLKQLSKCDNPFSCPHGRPTFIKITKYQIEKLFKRK